MSTELHDLLDNDPAAGLRGVAALMRERAEAAGVDYSSPWEVGGGTCGIRANAGRNFVASTYGGVGHEEATAAHIAGMHPAAALAVADLLARVADDYDIAKHGYWSAVAEKIARAYLGERDA